MGHEDKFDHRNSDKLVDLVMLNTYINYDKEHVIICKSRDEFN